jgi:hypothetical protein
MSRGSGRQRENRYPRNKKNRSRIGAGGFFAFKGADFRASPEFI